jgi:hypothetical protein
MDAVSYQVFFNKSCNPPNGRRPICDAAGTSASAAKFGALPQLCGVLHAAAIGSANNNSSSANSRSDTVSASSK